MNFKPLPRWLLGIAVIIGLTASIQIFRQERSQSPRLAAVRETPVSRVATDVRSAITVSAHVPASADSVNLSGDAAGKALEQGGRYDSLGAALAAARHAVEKIDPAGSGSRGADYFAFNPGQRLRAWFSKDGVELASGNRSSDGTEPWSVALRLRGIGREDAITAASTGTSSSEGSRVEMDHPNVAATQWFENRKEGLEQGFTLRERPNGGSDEVTILLEIEGNLHADTMASGDGIRLLDVSGVEKVRYDGLKVWDATGRDLDARMESSGANLTVCVSDNDAVYPLTIDPLFSNAEARLIQNSEGDQLGAAVSLSGETALIGAPGLPGVFVFTRSGTTWSKQAQLSTAEEDPFGNIMSLSGDTALVGPHVFVRTGTVWTRQARLVASDGANLTGPVAVEGNTALVGPYVFVRTGTVWSQQTKLVSSNGAALDGAVALSGNTAIVSAAPVSGNRKVHVYLRVGTVWNLQATLDATDLSPNDFYGGSLALSGDTALVGAPNQTTNIVAEGSVYFFKRTGTTWAAQGKLSGATDGDTFGASMAVSGDTAVIGSPGFITQSATIATRSGVVWSRQSNLSAPVGSTEGAYGSSVAISGTTILVGAPSSDTSAGKDAGSAYAYVRSGTVWNLQSDFEIDDAPTDDRNGYSVAVSGDTALVGAINDGFAPPPVFSPAFGCVYVFVRRGSVWTPQTKLTSSALSFQESFGIEVALSGDTALVGAPNGNSGGSAYVFVRSGAVWNQQARLTDPAVAAGYTYFGGAVALSGETALIGANSDDTQASPDAGSAYVFVRNGATWTQQAKLTAADGAVRDIFGGAVSISGDTALVGSFLDDTPAGVDSGSAYLFRRLGTAWTQEAKLIPADAAPADFCGDSVALTGGAIVSTTAWQNIPIGSRSGTFAVSFSLSPQAASTNGVAGLALGPADAYADLACSVRLNPLGFFEAGKGSGFDALKQVTYVAGKIYDVVMTVNTVSSTYSVSIEGTVIAENFAFRTEQAGIHRLDTLVLKNETGSHVVSDYGPVTALVGSPGDDTPGGVDSGSATVFVRGVTTWSQQARLTAGDAAAGDRFGDSLVLEGDTACVGAPTDDTVAGNDSGSAYVFVRYGTVWNQELRLTSGVDASVGDQFGVSVALSGSTAVVGATNDSTAGPAAGSAYTFLLGELPFITQQPVSKTVLPGRFVSFSIKATGYGPLSYQWRKDGAAIIGETGTSFTIASAQVANQGDYDCVVSNAGGVVTSAPARLSVNALSQFTQVFPGASPESLGFVFVTLSPSGVGRWRFQGEQLWRESGVPVGGLATGDRLIEFRPVPGYLQPPAEVVGVVSSGAATVVDRVYYETPSTGTGALTVTLKPDALAVATVPQATRAQWRLLGEDDTRWRDSEAGLSGLAAGNYLVECKPVAGRITPPPSPVVVADNQTTTRTLTYFIADPATGTLPTLVPFETVTTDQGKPYAYVGQIRSNVGSSSGFVVKQRVVATAGHVVFDDGTLSAVTGLQWLFQRQSGTSEPKPQTPRGFYLFDGYAAARSVPGVIPGEGTVASKNLDVAALYFVANSTTSDVNFPGRGGFGGYLASDAAVNEFLISPAQKILVGYPVDGISAGNQGRMHATAPLVGDPPHVANFTQASGRTYATPDIRSSGGMSGGPLCVQFENGNYYPAAVYLGGTGQAVVRSIDSQVIDMFNRAEASGSNDSNNTGGGITLTSVTPIGSNSDPGAIRVTILPAAAASAGRWGLKPESTNRSSGSTSSGRAAGDYILQLNTIGGFQAPTPETVRINGGQLKEITFTYIPDGIPAAPRISVQQTGGKVVPDGGLGSFGPVPVNFVETLTFAIKNTGMANLVVLAVTKDGADKTDFKVMPLQKTTLEPGASTKFKVTFKPSAKGTRKAAIHIKSNASNENTHDIKLTGKGVLKSAARPRFIPPPRLPAWNDFNGVASMLDHPKFITTVPFANFGQHPAQGVTATPVALWRQANFQTTSNIGDAADNADPDKDGQTNLSEYAAGTNPNSATDFFKILTTTKNPTAFTVTAAGKAARSYFLERRANLATSPWTTVTSLGPLSIDAPVTLTDPNSPPSAAFYRLRVSAPSSRESWEFSMSAEIHPDTQ